MVESGTEPIMDFDNLQFGGRPAASLEKGCVRKHEHLCFRLFALAVTASRPSTATVVRLHDEQPNKL
jgi:hypothetical protein